MTEKSPEKAIPIARVLVYAAVLFAIRYGCDFLLKNPQFLPSEPLVNTINFDSISARISGQDSFLHVGQTEEDVRMILGSPSGMMTITNRTILMYNGSFLEFQDGLLVTSDTNLLAEIKKVRRLPSDKSSSKKRK